VIKSGSAVRALKHTLCTDLRNVCLECCGLEGNKYVCPYSSKKYTIAVRGGSLCWSRIHVLFEGVFAGRLVMLLY